LPPERPAGAEDAVDPLLPDDPRGTARSPPECCPPEACCPPPARCPPLFPPPPRRCGSAAISARAKRGENAAPADGDVLVTAVLLPAAVDPPAGVDADGVLADDAPLELPLGAGRSTAVSLLPPGDPPPRGDCPANAGAAARAAPATRIPSFE
jgi:hypothetical protein